MQGVRWMIAIGGIAMLVASGCGRQAAPPATPETQAKAPQAPVAPAADPAAAVAKPQVEAYAYDPLGKRDPFRSFVLDRINEDETDEAKGPLEQFELSQLSVLGLVWETNNKRALVADPSGQGYIVKEGDRIGKNDGRVIGINDNLVLVREVYVDYVGEKTTKEIEMRVRQGQGG